MEPFNLIYLKYFIDAAEHNCISEAARKNFVTQSCISQGIKKLEQMLKIDLTMHLRNRFKLTDEGRIVFSKGKQVFRSMNGILDEISESNRVVMGKVVIATTQSLALAFLPQVFQSVAERFPQVEMAIRLGTIEQLHQWIKTDEVDFALALDQPEFGKYERCELAQGEFYLYRHESLKDWDTVYVDSLSGMAVAALECECVELKSWELVAEFLNSRLGAGVLPSYMTARYPHLVPIEAMNWRYTLCALYQKGIKLTRAASSVMSEGFL